MGLPALTRALTEQFSQIRPAAAADDLGVVISFDCEAPELEETFITPAGTRAHTINPLNWRTDATPADRSENPGACFTDYSGAITREETGLCGCYIDESRGILKAPDLACADYPAIVPGLPVCLKRKRLTHRTTRQSFSLSGAYSLSFFSMSRKYL